MPFLPILLSDGFSPHVAQGDKVTAGQIIAFRSAPAEIIINLSRELDVPAHTAFRYAKKNPGDSFRTGDILALRKKFFGTATKVISKSEGTVTKLERSTGEMFIQKDEIGEKVKGKAESDGAIVSPIEGTIALCNNEKILIDTGKDFLQGIKGFGGENTGIIYLLDESDTVETYHLQKEAIGKIAVGSFFPRDVLVKSVSMGISAIIGTKILDNDLAYLQKRNLQIPVIEIENADLNMLRKWNGMRTYLNGEGKYAILFHN